MDRLKKSILHLEDDNDYQAYINTLLSHVANVTSISSARDTRQLLIGCVFDMFILDLVLKDVSGASMARDLKAIYPDTPIIILSAHNVTGAIDEADFSFIKGKLDENDLIQTITNILY